MYVGISQNQEYLQSEKPRSFNYFVIVINVPCHILYDLSLSQSDPSC